MNINRFLFMTVNELLNYVHYLLVKLLPLIRLFLPWLGKERLAFEGLNQGDPFARSFREDHLQASMAFEVSSQGEFQQVLGVVNFLIQSGNLVEIIYASPSLESDIQSFKQQVSREQVRFLRLPLIRRSHFKSDHKNLEHWVTAKNFAFVRYDFYPHLLSMCFGAHKNVILFWGSLKNKLKSALSRWLWRQLSLSFKVIYAAGPSSMRQFQQLNPQANVQLSEMRLMAIEQRLAQREDKFQAAKVSKFLNLLHRDPRQKVVFGSGYVDDIEILQEKSFQQKLMDAKILLTIAPHDLATENLQRIKSALQSIAGLKFCVLQTDQETVDLKLEQDLASFHVIVLITKGILCEFYTTQDICYVGGGFERSIHSVIEPFWAGCSVLCGPKTHRSTEFDFCQEMDASRIESKDSRQLVAQSIGTGAMDTFKNEFHNRPIQYYDSEMSRLNELQAFIKGEGHRNS